MAADKTAAELERSINVLIESIQPTLSDILTRARAVASLRSEPLPETWIQAIYPFLGRPPSESILRMMKTEGAPMDREELMNKLIARGANMGHYFPRRDLARAINLAIEAGLIAERKGKLIIAEE